MKFDQNIPTNCNAIGTHCIQARKILIKKKKLQGQVYNTLGEQILFYLQLPIHIGSIILVWGPRLYTGGACTNMYD